MRLPKSLPTLLAGASAVVLAGPLFLRVLHGRPPIPEVEAASLRALALDTTLDEAGGTVTLAGAAAGSENLGVAVSAALAALRGAVRPLSDKAALETAFRGYFTYKAAHPDEVRKPYLLFVDYGLPSTAKRGYLFDMRRLKVVEGPFTVAHGRGSASSRFGIPTRFSNAVGSMATSLGLYVAKATYGFHGRSGGRSYSSMGLRLSGVSEGFNDNSLRRGVVAHGAPYVTASRAGRSEGCPAMEPARARRILPKLANGGVVFLFAPNEKWMENDPWIGEGGE
jgi:hypothetical protein